MLDYVSPK